MRALPLVLVLFVAGLSACRKMPWAAERSHVSKATPAAAAREPGRTAPTSAAKAEPTPRAINRSAQVAVLGYHRFVDKVRHPDTEITPADFEAQMQALKDGGIAVISLADFLAWRREEKDIPPKSALITIDDGYNVAYSVAWPILKKFGYPVTLFVYTDYIRGGPKSGGGSISWEQLAEMRDAGVGIGSHSVSHQNLRGGKGKADDAAYETWLWHELNGSKEQLEGRLGIKVTALALPYGLSNGHVREVATKAGYEMIFTVNGEKIAFDTPMDALGRWVVVSNQPKIFQAAITFREGQGSGGTAVASLSPESIQPVPAADARIKEPRPAIRASLASLETIDPGSVSLRVSGLGEVPAAFDPRTKAVSYQVVPQLPPKQYTVILSAKSHGTKLEARWNFTVQPAEDVPGAAGREPPR